jgi:uncharacterized Zn finger protein (UPF0148 family)
MVDIDNSFECNVCLNKFTSEGVREPKICIPCGHTICTECLNGIISSRMSGPSCPSCRIPLALDAATRKVICPTNYALVTVIQVMEQKALLQKFGRASESGVDDSRELLASLKTERARVANECGELQSQVSQLEQLLIGEKSKLLYVMKAMNELDLRISDIEGGRSTSKPASSRANSLSKPYSVVNGPSVSTQDSLQMTSSMKRDKAATDPFFIPEPPNRPTDPFGIHSSSSISFRSASSSSATDPFFIPEPPNQPTDPFTALVFDPFGTHSSSSVSFRSASSSSTTAIAVQKSPFDDFIGDVFPRRQGIPQPKISGNENASFKVAQIPYDPFAEFS